MKNPVAKQTLGRAQPETQMASGRLAYGVARQGAGFWLRHRAAQTDPRVRIVRARRCR